MAVDKLAKAKGQIEELELTEEQMAELGTWLVGRAFGKSLSKAFDGVGEILKGVMERND